MGHSDSQHAWRAFSGQRWQREIDVRYLGAITENNGAAMSVGRVSTFFDIYIERDVAEKTLTEDEAQEEPAGALQALLSRHEPRDIVSAVRERRPSWCRSTATITRSRAASPPCAPKLGNNDPRVDDMAADLVQRFMGHLRHGLSPDAPDTEGYADGEGAFGYVHSYETGSRLDGPGVRVTLFGSGCPLRCQYCHNPDTWHLKDGTRVALDHVVARLGAFAPALRAMRGGRRFPDFDWRVLRAVFLAARAGALRVFCLTLMLFGRACLG